MVNNINLDADARLVILVLICGGIGASVHALRSFTLHASLDDITWPWLSWYLFRPFEGAVIALVFYFVFRGGFSTVAQQDVSSVYTVGAIAVLTGMFSQQAVAKLKDIAESIFSKAQLTSSELSVAPSVTPAAIRAGSTGNSVTVHANGLEPRSVIKLNGTAQATTFVSTTEISAQIPDADVASPGTLQVLASTPGKSDLGPFAISVS